MQTCKMSGFAMVDVRMRQVWNLFSESYIKFFQRESGKGLVLDLFGDLRAA